MSYSAVAPSTSRVKRAAQRRARGKHHALGFVVPQLALLLLFVFWPLSRIVFYSFTQYDGFSDPEIVGLANFEFLANWQDFHRVLLNNALLIGGLLVWVTVPFLLAIAIFPMPGTAVVRAVLFIPAMLPPIIAGGVFRIVLADTGPVNSTLNAIGLGALAPGWFTHPNFVLVTVVLVIGWATMGSGILFFSTGIAAISPSYIEAALLDGANRWQMIWHIHRPALRPITRFWILLLTVTTVTGFFPDLRPDSRGPRFRVHNPGLRGLRNSQPGQPAREERRHRCSQPRVRRIDRAHPSRYAANSARGGVVMKTIRQVGLAGILAIAVAVAVVLGPLHLGNSSSTQAERRSTSARPPSGAEAGRSKTLEPSGIREGWLPLSLTRPSPWAWVQRWRSAWLQRRGSRSHGIDIAARRSPRCS